MPRRTRGGSSSCTPPPLGHVHRVAGVDAAQLGGDVVEVVDDGEAVAEAGPQLAGRARAASARLRPPSRSVVHCPRGRSRARRPTRRRGRGTGRGRASARAGTRPTGRASAGRAAGARRRATRRRASAAAAAMSSVPRSRLPPWKARMPKRLRSVALLVDAGVGEQLSEHGQAACAGGWRRRGRRRRRRGRARARARRRRRR